MNYHIRNDVSLNNVGMTKSKTVLICIIILILIKDVISNYIFILLASALLIVQIFKYRKIVVKTKTGIVIFYLIAVIGMALGIKNGIFNEIKDLIRVLTPVIFISIGVYTKKIYKDSVDLGNIIVLCYTLLSIIQLMRFFLEIFNGYTLNFASYKDMGFIGITNSLALIIALKQYADGVKKIGRVSLKISIFLLLVTMILSLSRTNYLFFGICLMITFLKKNYINVLLKVFIISALLVVVVLFHFLNINEVFTFYIEKIERSFTEISTNLIWNRENIQLNWRGYENYQALQSFKDMSIFQQMFGKGLGYKIYVGVYSELVGENLGDSIIVLHSGFSTFLPKIGISGLILYLVFHIVVILKAVKYDQQGGRYVIAIIIAVLLLTHVAGGFMVSHGMYFECCLLIGFYLTASNSDSII